MRRVLILGGCGFVGRHFVKRLIDLGDAVTVVDNLYSGIHGHAWAFDLPKKRLNFIYMDARSYFRFNNADKFDLVIHLAAIVGGRLNIENDPLAVATDLSIDAEMFNWVVRAKKVPKVIYFSSSAAYPIFDQTRDALSTGLRENFIDLDVIENPDMTYGWAKLSGEYLAKFAHEKYGLDVRIYRPFGGYGPDQDLTYPVPAIIERVNKRENPIIIWGSGEQKRDFIWIDDVVGAVEATMDVKELSGKPLNLGTGRATSFFDLARMACDIMGHDAAIRNDPTKPEGVFCRVADVTEMNKYYTPTVTLEEGLRRMLQKSEPAARSADIQSSVETSYATYPRYGRASDQGPH